MRVRDNSFARGFPTVLMLLLILVIVPTAGVVWFMAESLRNERAAVRQTLTAAWEVQLAASAKQVEASWLSRRQHLGMTRDGELPAEVFARLVREGTADSVLVYDADERVLYPADPEFDFAIAQGDSADWRKAERLEFSEGRFEAAGRKYADISRTVGDVQIAARALRAQARCLGKAGRKDDAVEIIKGELGQSQYREARDHGGRLIVPQSLLLALHLLDDRSTEAGRSVVAELERWLADYSEPVMPPTQRLFLARQMQQLVPGAAVMDTLAAEDLADRYLKSDRSVQPSSRLSNTALPGVWQIESADGRVVALFHESTVSATVESVRSDDMAKSQVELELLPPSTELSQQPFLVHSMTGSLSGWLMVLNLVEEHAIDVATDEGTAATLWTGALLIVAAVFVAMLTARLLSRQIRLARLKNDLASTVTHELRTPLASTRLLIDTLLSGDNLDEPKTREYLELMAGENRRLSRLIDDFLSFSRLERNKQTFDKALVDPADVAETAIRAVQGRYDSDSCQFEVEIDDNLPRIEADPEAISTVLVNLLDNACKYTPDNKEILLRARSEDNHVLFDVRDNGIGLSRRAARRVFDRFYRVDNDLTRCGGGTGLGLAIVKFIVDAHDGEIGVDSSPGEGSTFSVRLKAAA